MNDESSNFQQEISNTTESPQTFTREQNQFINVQNSEILEHKNKQNAFTMTDVSYLDNNLNINHNREYQEYLK